MEKTQQIVILAAGDFPTHAVPLQALREADFVVCCDSAFSQLNTTHYPLSTTHYIVIGDGDSLSEADKSALGERWLQVDEQDYNDLHKAVQWAVCHFPPRTSHFTILGATGRREDHTLGNIAYLVTFAEEHPGIRLEMLTDYGRFTAMTGSGTFTTFPRQQVSIFSMDPDRPIYGQGLRWPLDAFRARRWWQATLNEALGSEVTLSSDGWLVVFQTYDSKE